MTQEIKKENKEDKEEEKFVEFVEIDANNFKGEEELPQEIRLPNTAFNNKILRPLDKFLFKITERVILHFVKKSKYTKNKYKVQVTFKKIMIASLILFVFVFYPAVSILTKGPKSPLIVTILFYLIFTFIIIAEVIQLLKLIMKAVDYDEIFLRRKNPQIYKFEKIKCLLEFELLKRIRAKAMFSYCVTTSIFWFLLILIWFPIKSLAESLSLSYFVFFALQEICFILDNYTKYVFDFDKPEKKKKEVKSKSLGRIMEQAFERMKDLVKQPSPIPVPCNYEIYKKNL
jgi:hypothetical protein